MVSYGQIRRRNETEQEDGESERGKEDRLARSQHRISMGIVLPVSC